MAEKTKKKSSLWTFAENFEGDKVVWMIVLLLMMISIVAIFSSTTQLALQQGTTRMAIVGEQMAITLAGLVLIIICYNIKSIGFYRVISQLGFMFCLFLLLILAFKKQVGPFKPEFINHAWRIVKVGGIQIHVFEVTKIGMVMYLSWAVNAYVKDKFMIANILAKKYPILGKPIAKKLGYIYIPMFIVCVLIMVGSLSSTLLIGLLMFFTILIGGISIRELILPAIIAIGILFGCIGINQISDKPADKKPFPHLETALNRIKGNDREDTFEILRTEPRGSEKFQEALDESMQPVSAKLAIHQGGLIGKGPGRSTQRYVTPIMFEDYMFSFIVEEYGLLGGIFVIILYVSLMARGSIIVKNCDNQFAKTCVAGLVFLISVQAMLHIMVNCDLGPHTGQTLPMISHGNSSFLMFSIAFGIILSISRMAKRKIDKESAKAAPLVEHDNVRDSVSECESLDNDIQEEADELSNFDDIQN